MHQITKGYESPISENNVVIGHYSDSTGISSKPVIILGDNIKKDNIRDCYIFENEAYVLIIGKTILNLTNNTYFGIFGAIEDFKNTGLGTPSLIETPQTTKGET